MVGEKEKASTNEPRRVTVLLFVTTKELLVLVLEGQVEGLGGEVTDHVGNVTTPQRTETFRLDGSGEAITNAAVRVRKTARLDHLILVLHEQFDTLDGRSSRLGDSSGDTAHHKVL